MPSAATLNCPPGKTPTLVTAELVAQLPGWAQALWAPYIGKWICGPLTLGPPDAPGAGVVDTIGGALGAIPRLILRIAVGAAGLALILVGAMMISADLTASEAAARLGSEMGKAMTKGTS